MRKVLGSLLVVFGLSLALLSADIFSGGESPSTRQSTFSQLWKRDINQLEAKNKLPKPFFEISEVKIAPLNKGAKQLLKNLSHPFKIDPNGRYKLEVMMDLWQDEEGYGVLMMYSLMDKNSNTVWEMSRTLTL